MTTEINRRILMAAACALAAGAALPGVRPGQAEAALLGGVLGAGHPRRDDEACSPRRSTDDFTLEPYYGGNLFKQGTELVALQRGNLEMGNIAPQDISKPDPGLVDPDLGLSVPRRRASRRRSSPATLGAELKKMAEDQLGIAHPRADLFRRRARSA